MGEERASRIPADRDSHPGVGAFPQSDDIVISQGFIHDKAANAAKFPVFAGFFLTPPPVPAVILPLMLQQSEYQAESFPGARDSDTAHRDLVNNHPLFILYPTN